MAMTGLSPLRNIMSVRDTMDRYLVDRWISLPRTVEVDKAATGFENGVLTLTLRKTPDAKPGRSRSSRLRRSAPARLGAEEGTDHG